MKRSVLYALQVQAYANMTRFYDWEIPQHYAAGVNLEHLAVREGAGLFDISYLSKTLIEGADALAFLRHATLNDPALLRQGAGQLTFVPNALGGVNDTLLLYRTGAQSYLLSGNPGHQEMMLLTLTSLARDFDVRVTNVTDAYAIFALQGPAASWTLAKYVSLDLATLGRHDFVTCTVDAHEIILARSGFTGEDGFELWCQPASAEALWRILLQDDVLPCGLAARQTLRLEAGLPQMGEDLSAETNPRCTPYFWAVKDKDIFAQNVYFDTRCAKKLVGLRLQQRVLARAGYRVLTPGLGEDDLGDKVGEVTSGEISPLTRDAVALAWVRRGYSDIGTEVCIEVRGVAIPAVVSALPFI